MFARLVPPHRNGMAPRNEDLQKSVAKHKRIRYIRFIVAENSQSAC
jgi:hypothetical protein